MINVSLKKITSELRSLGLFLFFKKKLVFKKNLLATLVVPVENRNDTFSWSLLSERSLNSSLSTVL